MVGNSKRQQTSVTYREKNKDKEITKERTTKINNVKFFKELVFKANTLHMKYVSQTNKEMVKNSLKDVFMDIYNNEQNISNIVITAPTQVGKTEDGIKESIDYCLKLKIPAKDYKEE